MNNLFNTRPNYRICLGFNAEYAFATNTEVKARVGADITQVNPKYMSILKMSQLDGIIKDGFHEEKVKTTISTITIKTKSTIYLSPRKEIEQVLERLYTDLTRTYDVLTAIQSSGTLVKIRYFFLRSIK